MGKKTEKGCVFLFPLKTSLPCSVCIHSDKQVDRTCAGCLLGKSSFKLKTERQIALMGLKVGPGGEIYKELSDEIN